MICTLQQAFIHCVILPRCQKHQESRRVLNQLRRLQDFPAGLSQDLCVKTCLNSRFLMRAWFYLKPRAVNLIVLWAQRESSQTSTIGSCSRSSSSAASWDSSSAWSPGSPESSRAGISAGLPEYVWMVWSPSVVYLFSIQCQGVTKNKWHWWFVIGFWNLLEVAQHNNYRSQVKIPVGLTRDSVLDGADGIGKSAARSNSSNSGSLGLCPRFTAREKMQSKSRKIHASIFATSPKWMRASLPCTTLEIGWLFSKGFLFWKLWPTKQIASHWSAKVCHGDGNEPRTGLLTLEGQAMQASILSLMAAGIPIVP